VARRRARRNRQAKRNPESLWERWEGRFGGQWFLLSVYSGGPDLPRYYRRDVLVKRANLLAAVEWAVDPVRGPYPSGPDLVEISGIDPHDLGQDGLPTSDMLEKAEVWGKGGGTTTYVAGSRP